MKPDVNITAQQALEGMGLSGLEAQVYLALLNSAPITGYQVAKRIGKPVANTYKAIESLVAKGAVWVDTTEKKICRAVPPEEFLEQLDRKFQTTRAHAVDALADLPTPESDERLYNLASTEQVIERCRAILRDAEKVVLLDLFPVPMELLRADIVDALDRGLEVGIKAYAPVEFPRGSYLVAEDRTGVSSRWPGQWMNVVADSQELVIAYLSEDGTRVHQALWTSSAYIGFIYQGALASEISLTQLAHVENPGPELAQALEADRRFTRPDLRGFVRLQQRFAKSPARPQG